MSSDDHVRVERRGRVGVITLLADARLNAVRREGWSVIRDALDELERDSDVGVILFVGDGKRAFCAGGDIKGYDELRTAGERRAFIADCLRTFGSVETTTKPVVAAVNGVALGGGMELALACDVVLAAESASFALPEASLGLAPGFGIVRLRDWVGPGWAKYLVFSGARLTAADAHRLGIVQRILPDDGFLEHALEEAERMAGSAPLAMAMAKSVINSGLDLAYQRSLDAVVMLQGTEDATEGNASFAERRRPQFRGR